MEVLPQVDEDLGQVFRGDLLIRRPLFSCYNLVEVVVITSDERGVVPHEEEVGAVVSSPLPEETRG